MDSQPGKAAQYQERTRSFDRDQPIDCRRWTEFTIVESTYRYFRIRFTERVLAREKID